MNLRHLQVKDAGYMLEWMHDDEVVHFLSANFATKKIDDCLAFIEYSQNKDKDINLAIVDEKDEYMGTVSLKHINTKTKTAEFAITMRKCAMGKGYSTYGMAEIIKMGIEEIGLEKIYWCVSCKNERAIRFYDKNKYKRTNDIPDAIKDSYSKEQNEAFIWYVYA